MSIDILGKQNLNKAVDRNNEDDLPRERPPTDYLEFDARLFELTAEITTLDGEDVEGVYEGKMVLKEDEVKNDYIDDSDGDTFNEAEGTLLFEINKQTGGVGKRVWGWPILNDDGKLDWLISIGGGGTDIPKIKITFITNDNTYTGRIIDNRTDQNELTGDDVTIKALDHTTGQFDLGDILDCTYDATNDHYEPIGYNYFY